MTRFGEHVDHGPSVVDGKIVRTSVTQVTSADPEQDGGCLRKWWFKNVAHKPEPEQSFHVLGKEVHGQIEHYLKTGENVLGDVARAGKHLIPEPLVFKPRLRIEEGPTLEARDLTALGIPFVGFIDVENTRQEYITPQGDIVADPGVVELLDWKTTSDFKWAKSGPGLVKTVQMIGYAEYARRRYPWAEAFRLSHVAFLTRGKPEARKATIVIPIDTVLNRWVSIESTVARMGEAATITDAAKVPANYAACSAFRGCPHQSYCPRTSNELLTSIFGGSTMSLLATLNAQVGNAAALPATAPPNPAPVPVAAPAPEAMAEDPAKMICIKCESPVNPVGNMGGEFRWWHDPESKTGRKCERSDGAVNRSKVCPAPRVVVTDTVSTPATAPAAPSVASDLVTQKRALLAEIEAAERAAVAVTVVVPPPAAVVLPAAIAPVLAPDAAKAGQSGPVAEPLPVGMTLPAGVVPVPAATAPVTPSAAPAVSDATPAPAEPKRRGRPPGSGKKATGTPAADRALASNQADAAGQTFLELFVDCVVEGIDAEPLDQYIDDVCTTLAKSQNVADIRCAPNDSPLGFAKWKGALCAVVRSAPPANGAYTLTHAGESEIKAIVLEALRPLCATFVRGVR